MGLLQSQLRRQQHSYQHKATYVPCAQCCPREEQDSIMPDHWKFEFDWLPKPYSILARVVIQVLCLIALGHSDLSAVWKICIAADQTSWNESTARLYDLLNTIVVVAGLLLSSTAAFLTTTPPLPNEFNYNKGGAYICLLLSFAASLGTLVVGSSIMFVVSKCDCDWFKNTHMSSASRIVCTMYLISYPFLSMGVSVSVAAIGLLVAAWSSKNDLIAKGGVWLLLFPATCLPIWWWTQKPIVQGGTTDTNSPRQATTSEFNQDGHNVDEESREGSGGRSQGRAPGAGVRCEESRTEGLNRRLLPPQRVDAGESVGAEGAGLV